MPKIAIERETLEQAITALTYHQSQTRPIESTRITLDILRASLAAQPATVDDHLKCGHHRSLAINSAETGEVLYCDLCDAKSRCRDAETMEEELRAALAAQPAIGVTCTMTDAPCTRNCGIACSLQMEALAAQSAEPVACESCEELQQLCDRLVDLLTRTAAALKGPPPPLTLHDWSDLPDVASDVAAVARLKPYAAPPAPAAVPPDERVRVLREALTGWLEMGYSREREAATLDLLEATK